MWQRKNRDGQADPAVEAPQQHLLGRVPVAKVGHSTGDLESLGGHRRTRHGQRLGGIGVERVGLRAKCR